MGLFGFGSSKKDKMIKELVKENDRLRKLSDEKDAFFLASISDGLRHGSPQAAKHMADRKCDVVLQRILCSTLK